MGCSVDHPISHKSDTSGGRNAIVMLRKHFRPNDCADQSFADDMSREVFLYMYRLSNYLRNWDSNYLSIFSKLFDKLSLFYRFIL